MLQLNLEYALVNSPLIGDTVSLGICYFDSLKIVSRDLGF